MEGLPVKEPRVVFGIAKLNCWTTLSIRDSQDSCSVVS